MAFKIEWMVYDGEWEDALAHHAQYGAGTRFDSEFPIRSTALFSSVQLRHNDTALFPTAALRAEARAARRSQARRGEPVDPPDTPIDLFGWALHPIHLAGFFSWLLFESGFPDSPDLTLESYHDPESSFYLAFQKHDEFIFVGSTWEKSPILRVPETEFFDGVREYLQTLTLQIRKIAPELLSWPEVTIIKYNKFPDHE